MSWIELLYPKPNFDLSGWPRLIRAVHGRALAFAYYASQTLALIGLAILYLSVILPIRGWQALRGEDPLELRFTKEPSYLKKAPPVAQIDFTRMY
ncbi:MAG TPA: hypothetical protein PL182_13830 [Pseudobdellovibrionaceae bacterium]|nr:hypothetical protein [Pseudobdellovibrionaceae bacterium]